MEVLSMNKDMINRLKTAAGYQKKAILALLPESTAGHLEVIGKELKLMLAEMAEKVEMFISLLIQIRIH